jgi:RHS repeat-associated protein
VVRYTYDAYGNITYQTSNQTIGTINPYKYREYRYDSEIKMYYLNSRFYNPKAGRFLNADGLFGQTGDILSTNMYAYCANNPVMYLDPSGLLTEETGGQLLVLMWIVASFVVYAVNPEMFGAAAISGIMSLLGQIASNIANGADWTQGAIGSLTGGMFTVSFGILLGPVIGGLINAIMNELENEWLYDSNGFSQSVVLWDSIVYTLSNYYTGRLTAISLLGLAGKYFAIDAITYTAYDFVKKIYFERLGELANVE